jgi:hypothetical protein
MRFRQLPCCAYCERSAAEIVNEDNVPPDEALRFVLIGGANVLLCPDCCGLREPLNESEVNDLLTAVIDLPPNIRAIEHHCPALEAEEDPFPVFTVRLTRQGDYFLGGCEHCGMRLRSAVQF